jgi:hypothetical protein
MTDDFGFIDDRHAQDIAALNFRSFKSSVNKTLDHRWFSRFSDGWYFPDWAIETEFDSDEFNGWEGVTEIDVTDRLIAMLKAQKKNNRKG